MNLKQRYQGNGNKKRGIVIILTRDKRHIRKRTKNVIETKKYIRQEREIKDIHIGGEELKLFLFTYEIILCQEYPKKYYTNTIRINKPFSKVVGYTIKVENSIVFFIY